MLPCFWGCWQSGVPWPGEALPTFAPGGTARVLPSQPQACCVAPARCPPCDLPILHSPWMPSSQNQPHSQSEGQGPPWAPRESPAKSRSAKPATPLQDGGLRPRRVVPFVWLGPGRGRTPECRSLQSRRGGRAGKCHGRGAAYILGMFVQSTVPPSHFLAPLRQAALAPSQSWWFSTQGISLGLQPQPGRQDTQVPGPPPHCTPSQRVTWNSCDT